MKQYKALIYTILIVLIVFACKKEQPEIKEAEDPCACASEVSADFDILERFHQGGGSEYTLTDHVLSHKGVAFRAKEDDAEYTWYIGVDVEHERQTEKFFGSQWSGSTIPITLVVKKEPNKVCFPDDDGYDSITKTFNVYDGCDTHFLDGEYIVAEENSTDSLNLGLIYVPEANPIMPEFCSYYEVINYDGKGSICEAIYNRTNRNYRALRSSSGGSYNEGCKAVWINLAEINFNNVFKIDLYYKEELGGPNIYKTYYGRKLP